MRIIIAVEILTELSQTAHRALKLYSAAGPLHSFPVLRGGEDLAPDVLQLGRREGAMMAFKVVIRTTLLLVDGHIQQVEVPALVL